MQIQVKTENYKEAEEELIILPFFQEQIEELKEEEPTDDLPNYIFNVAIDANFEAKPNQVLLTFPPAIVKTRRLMLLGLGKQNKFSLEKLRRSCDAAIKQIKKIKLDNFAMAFPEITNMENFEITNAIVEGFMLGAYNFDKYKSEKKELAPKIKTLTILTEKDDIDEIVNAVKRAMIICLNVNQARDLVNENADVINPKGFASKAKEICSKTSLKFKVYDDKDLKKKGMNLILAVGSGATSSPRLAILEYNGDKKSKEKIALVGKGVTFDSGGLNLKPTNYIENMRCDMAGAAAVLYTIKTLAELKIKKNVIAAIPLAENAIDSKSYKPGDIFKSYSGKTVEILNTDAEGRLILADALAYVSKNYKPIAIIDLATLTGSVMVTFGEYVTGMFSTNKELVQRMTKAGERTFERVWELPLYEEYEEEMKSDTADLKNIGYKSGKFGGAITAASFLKQFVGKTPWMHLDIAGSAWRDAPKYYNSKGGTGMGVRLLTRFFMDLD